MQNKNSIYILSEKKFTGAKNLPVIKINFLDKQINLSRYDALVFTSKNAVEALEKNGTTWRDKELYSIGTGTTKAIEEKGAKATYTAKSSYGDNFAQEISKILKDKKVLFPRAKVVTSKLNIILKSANIDLEEEIVYETVCNNNQLKKPEKNSIIIFSSPSTIECFFKKFTWDISYKAVVIGEKTASFMPSEISYILSSKQNIPACIEVAESLLHI